VSKPEPSLLARLVNEGLAHHRSGRFGQAEELYRQVLTLDPENADALHLQGMLAYQEGRLDQAVASISRAIAAHPGAAAYHANLGNVLQAQDRLGQAVESYRRALELRPDVAEVHLNLGNVLQALGDVDGARAAFARALALRPGLAEARAAQAMALLLQGDFRRGWEEFEGRWKTRDYDTPWRPYAQPLWQGERSSRGPVLIWGEQGVGDEIMFAGLVPDAIATGVALLLECDPRLVPLFRRSFPSLRVLARGEGRPAEGQSFAAHTPSGSLPRLFRTSLADFEATTSPYLVADPERRTMLRDHYGRGRGLVGLAWHTRAGKTGRRRSIDLEALGPLFATASRPRWRPWIL